MGLIQMDKLLRPARAEKYAIAAFECWNSANIYGLAAAAEKCGTPIIFQASPAEYELMGGPEIMSRIVKLYVEKTGITAALHLDHGTTLAQVEECIDAGFTSVMLDASALPLAENLALSRQAAEMAHRHQVSVEAELGHVGGSAEGGIVAESTLTDPDEAAYFVRETGIDCLAVAVGTVHGEYRGTPHIRLERLRQIADRVGCPLVLHGGSGTPPELLRQAIGLGIAKINICTDIHKVWLAGIEQAKATLTPSVPGNFYRPAHELLVAKATAMIQLFQGKEETR